MILVLILAFAFLAMSIAGQRLVGKLLGVALPIRPLLPFAPGTRPLHQVAVRAGGALFTWLLLFAVSYSVLAREERYSTTVEVVPGLPAAQAGMQTGDRVVQVDGQGVADFSELKERIAFGGKEIRLLVVRGEQELKFTVSTEDGLLGLKVHGEPTQLSSGATLQRALLLPLRVLRLVPTVLGANGPKTITGSPSGGPNLLVGLVLTAALGWWLSVLLEVLALGVNALARR